MKIGPAEVLRVARLAELDVPDADLAELAAQLDRIVEYVAQLGDLGLAADAPAFIPGPAAAPLRPDRVAPIPLARPPSELAPDFREGLFLVPRLAGMEGE